MENMNTYKNYIIALLTGLLVLTITTQPSIGAGKSKEAKIVEYDSCLKASIIPTHDQAYYTNQAIKDCKAFQP